MLPAGFAVAGCILRVCGSVFPARKLRERGFAFKITDKNTSTRKETVTGRYSSVSFCSIILYMIASKYHP